MSKGKKPVEFGGSELFDVLDGAADRNSDPNYRQSVVGNQIKRALGSESPYGEFGDDGIGQRNPGSSQLDDPRGSIVKPAGKYWTKVPSTDEEKAIYDGLHIHSQDNPFGLHSHVPGGALGGAHGHGPSNQTGQHFHGVMPSNGGKLLDGRHVHTYGENMPGGKHEHCPENFA